MEWIERGFVFDAQKDLVHTVTRPVDIRASDSLERKIKPGPLADAYLAIKK